MFLWSLFAKFSSNLLDQATAGFEIPAHLTKNPFQEAAGAPGIMPLDPKLYLPPGWKTVGNQKPAALWILTGSKMLGSELTTPHGRLFLDLTGYHTKPTFVAGIGNVFGGIELSEPIKTTPGKKYEISFLTGTREDHASMSGPVAVLAIMGSGAGLVQGFVHPRQKGAQMKWTRHHHIFTAVSDRTPVTLWASGHETQRRKAEVDDDSELLGLDDIGIREVTFLGRVLDFFTRALRFAGLSKTPLRFDPTLPRP